MEENLDYKAIIDGVESVSRFGKLFGEISPDSTLDGYEFLQYYKNHLSQGRGEGSCKEE